MLGIVAQSGASGSSSTSLTAPLSGLNLYRPLSRLSSGAFARMKRGIPS
jgi:hypothetical protein